MYNIHRNLYNGNDGQHRMGRLVHSLYYYQSFLTKGTHMLGARAWNNLPVDMRLSRTFSTFKTHLKSQVFNISSNCTGCQSNSFFIQTAFDVLRHVNPSYLRDLLTIYNPSCNLRSSSQPLCWLYANCFIFALLQTLCSY